MKLGKIKKELENPTPFGFNDNNYQLYTLV